MPGHCNGRTETELAELIARVAAKERVAFRHLYDLTATTLFRVAVFVTRRRDVAEDALQEAYVRIWQSAGQFDPDKGKAMAWLSAIVRRAAFTALSSERARQLEPDFDLASVPGPAATLALLEDADEERLLLEALAALPEQKREVIAAAYLRGESRAETAARMGVPVATLKTWIRRAAIELKANAAALQGGGKLRAR